MTRRKQLLQLLCVSPRAALRLANSVHPGATMSSVTEESLRTYQTSTSGLCRVPHCFCPAPGMECYRAIILAAGPLTLSLDWTRHCNFFVIYPEDTTCPTRPPRTDSFPTWRTAEARLFIGFIYCSAHPPLRNARQRQSLRRVGESALLGGFLSSSARVGSSLGSLGPSATTTDS